MNNFKTKRKAWTVDEASKHVEAHAHSGKSMAAYGRENGIDAGRLWWWRRKLRNERKQAVERAFVPVVVADRAHDEPEINNAGCIEVRLRGKRTLSISPGFDPTTLQQVVKALEVLSC